jgi:hypothetical protein
MHTALSSYPDVKTILCELLAGVQAILCERFVGMYLYGSLAAGDFDPQTSDIDFLVVTDDELPEELVAALEAMHARLAVGSSKWAAKLEGAYMPRRVLRRYDPGDAPNPCIHEGDFYLARQGSDWVIQRHILREHGVVMAGPPPHTLIDPVSPEELQQAVVAFLRKWWQPMLDDPTRLQRPDYQVYAVLTICRALYTLQNETVVSKPAAAKWAQETLDGRWPALIARALAWRSGERFEHLDEVMAVIGYALKCGSPS